MTERKPYRIKRAVVRDAQVHGYYTVGDIVMCSADVGRILVASEIAEPVAESSAPETTRVAAPENATRKRGRPRKAKPKATAF